MSAHSHSPVQLCPDHELLEDAVAEALIVLRAGGECTSADLQTAWRAAEMLAMGRLFGERESRGFECDNVRCERLISLALACWSFSGSERYLNELRRGRISALDALIIYVRVATTCDWLEDLSIRLGRGLPPEDDARLSELRAILYQQKQHLRPLLCRDPSLREFLADLLRESVRPLPNSLRSIAAFFGD